MLNYLTYSKFVHVTISAKLTRKQGILQWKLLWSGK